MIRAKTRGLGSLRGRLQSYKGAQRKAVKEVMSDSLGEVRREARRNLRRNTNQGRSTGALADSVAVRLAADGLGGSVGTDLPHGRYLEFGTRRMAARPWLQPAFESLKPQLRRRLADALRSAGRAAARGRSARGE